MINIFKYTEKKLAKEIANIAKSIDPTLIMTYLQDSNEVKLGPEGDINKYTLYLGNIFKKYSALPKGDRLKSIRTYLEESLTPIELSDDQFLNTLALRVRTQYELDLRAKHFQLAGNTIQPSLRFNTGDLVIEVVSDREESLSIPSIDTITGHGASKEEAIEIASAKLRRYTDKQKWQKVDESIWISSYIDDYDVARLITTEPYDMLPFDDGLVMYAPSHSVCLITNTRTPEVLSRLIEIGDEQSTTHRHFSQNLWVFDSGFKKWNSRDCGAELKDLVKLQSLKEMINQYQETKAYFEKSITEDIFIATFKAIQNDKGPISYCVYTFDVVSYLPKTDYVAVVDASLPEDQTVIGWLDWQDFHDLVGTDNLKTVNDTIPQWYTLLPALNNEVKNSLKKASRAEI